MWKGNAAILNAKPANAASRPSSTSGWPGTNACATPPRSVVRAAPYTNESPYAITAEETVPTRDKLRAAAPAPLHEREPVRHPGGGAAAGQEELQGSLDRYVLSLEKAREDVERDGHELEGDEEQDQIAGRREDQHPEERGEDEQVILAGATAGRDRGGEEAGGAAAER